VPHVLKTLAVVAAVLTVSVLFPTPPFWLIKVTTAALPLPGFSFLKWDAI
jgi:hypothetical protein